ncbi:MAG: hypothetical protein CL675_02665 [Bdellovibrionaceae bacterium]|nr:hypothetical protein [Pseudobdellovibrionaceae bacterium]
MRLGRAFVGNRFVMLLAVVMSGCGFFDPNHIEPGLDPQAQTLGMGPSFEEVSQKVLGPSCVECHSSYSNYRVVRADLNQIMESIREGRMPKRAPALEGASLALLEEWVGNGAPQFTRNDPPSDDAPKPVELAPNYQSVALNIFGARCTTCHSPTGRVDFLDFSTRLSVMQNASEMFDFENPEQSYMLEVIQDPLEPMPPLDSGIPQLTEEEIAVLQEWIRLGLP